MTRAEAVRAAASRLAAAGAETPSLDARLLALDAFGLTSARLLADGEVDIPPDEQARLGVMVERREAGEPVDRILGRREFWGMSFALAPATLAPRPETETVVEAALGDAGPADRALQILDLGTGSGCLLLALLSERPNATGVGVDRSLEAAAAARENAEALGFASRARFVVGDWASAIEGRFDLVVSNPPYVARREIEALDREVRLHDPRLALDGGEDGLDAYRAILAEATRLLAPGGAMALELGMGQLETVAAIAEASGLAVLRAVPDLAGTPRALLLRAAIEARRM